MLNVYKLKNGDDLMGEITEQDVDYISIEYPVTYSTLPNNGFQMRDWCLLVKDIIVNIPRSEILVDLGEPNEFGAQCYFSFVKSRKEQRKYLEDEANHSFEEFDDDCMEESSKRKLSKDVEELFAALRPNDKSVIN